MMIYHTTLLLSAAWALLIFNEKQVYCGIIIVSSSSETLCNGMRCPPLCSCAVSVNNINGNTTSDTKCSNITTGEVVRQEIKSVSNGQICIKNVTKMGENLNVEQSCRNLSKEETDDMEQRQYAIKVAMQERSKLQEEQMHELEKRINEKTVALEMAAHKIAQAAEDQAEQLKASLADMQRKLEASFDWTKHLWH